MQVVIGSLCIEPETSLGRLQALQSDCATCRCHHVTTLMIDE